MPIEHLSDGDIAGYLDQHLPPEDRARVEAHLDACSQCRTALIDVQRLSDSYAPGETGATASSARHAPAPVIRIIPRRRWGRRVAGAVAVAAGLTVVAIVRRDPEVASAVRSEAALPAAATVVALSPEDGARVGEAHPVFRWRAPGHALFRFVLLDSTGAPVWVEETTDSALTLSPEVILRPGESYFWRVDAIADGIAGSTTANRFNVVR